MVQLDLSGQGSGFKPGCTILPDVIGSHSLNTSHHRKSVLSTFFFCRSESGSLSTSRSTAPTNALQKGKYDSGSILLVNPYSPPPQTYTPQRDLVITEVSRNLTKIELDLVLDSVLAVEGEHLRGSLKIKVPISEKKEGPFLMADLRLRIVGIESV